MSTYSMMIIIQILKPRKRHIAIDIIKIVCPDFNLKTIRKTGHLFFTTYIESVNLLFSYFCLNVLLFYI